MRNFKISLDLSDAQQYLKNFVLREYSLPFCLIFIEADDPDDACHESVHRLLRLIVDQKYNIETRVLCRKLKKLIRIDKIISL